MSHTFNLILLAAFVALNVLYVVPLLFRLDAARDVRSERSVGMLVRDGLVNVLYLFAVVYTAGCLYLQIGTAPLSSFLLAVIASALAAAVGTLSLNLLKRGDVANWRPRRSTGGGSGCINPV